MRTKNGKLRIVSVSIPYPMPHNPIAGLFVQRRVQALAGLADVSVISPQPWFPWFRPYAPGKANSAEQPPTDRPRMPYLPGLLKSLDGYWLRHCLEPALRRIQSVEGRVDVLDAQFEYPEAVGCVMVAERLGLPVFVTLRGLLTKCLASRAHRGPMLWALRRATGIISVAHALKETAVRHGIPASNIRVIPNAVDAGLFHPGPRDESRRELGLDVAGPLVVTVGHLQSLKGQHLLVPAFARAREQWPGARLAIIGNKDYDRAYTHKVMHLIETLGLGASVTLVGGQTPDRVARWLRAADIFALPTHHEGCCNAVLEALACGLPVVTTPVGDNADFIEGSGGGVLVPVGDVDALARALDRALRQSWDRLAIAVYASRRSWPRVAEETLNFFHEQLAGPGTGVAAHVENA